MPYGELGGVQRRDGTSRYRKRRDRVGATSTRRFRKEIGTLSSGDTTRTPRPGLIESKALSVTRDWCFVHSMRSNLA